MQTRPGEIVTAFRQLEEDFGISASTARRYTAYLEASHYIEIKQRGRGGTDGIILAVKDWDKKYTKGNLKDEPN